MIALLNLGAVPTADGGALNKLSDAFFRKMDSSYPMQKELPEKWKHVRTAEEFYAMYNSREFWEWKKTRDPLDDEIIELDFEKYFGETCGATILSVRSLIYKWYSNSLHKLPRDVQLRIKRAVIAHRVNLPAEQAAVKQCPECLPDLRVQIDEMEKHLAVPHKQIEWATVVKCEHQDLVHVRIDYGGGCGMKCTDCSGVRICFYGGI